MGGKNRLSLWFKRLKGFGFIQPEDNQKVDMFVQYTAIDGDRYRDLTTEYQEKNSNVPN